MCSPLKRAETFVAQRVHFVFSGVLGGPSRLVTADGELLPAQLSATVGRSQAWDEGTPGSQASPAPRGFRQPSAKQPSAHAASPPEWPTCPCLPATYASAPGVPDRRSAPHGSPRLSSCSSVTALLTPRHVAPPPRTGRLVPSTLVPARAGSDSLGCPRAGNESSGRARGPTRRRVCRADTCRSRAARPHPARPGTPAPGRCP